MERLKRSFRNSFRRKKSSTSHQTESSKPHQWEGDEIAVRNGNCSFPVKYLGCVQVQDSRGMHICEQALLTLKAQKKGKSIKGQLYVSGDGLRVVDDETKGLIVDQTIEKVSFCAPDRNHDRGFSYICRDGTTRRWMCHGFLASKDTGDRLSHAVGCSFAVCLERKQKRDAKLAEIKQVNAVTNNSSLNSLGSSMNNSLNSTEVNENSRQNFSRTGSFRRIPMKQRIKDPQECKLIEPVPVKEVHNPYAIRRPHATPQLLERQGSCRIFKDLNQNSPFKRQLSLRFTPSQMERQQRKTSLQTQDSMFNKYTDTSINNFQLNSTNQQSNNLTNNKFNENFNDQNNRMDNNELKDVCKNISDNLSILSNKQNLFDDNFQFNKTSITNKNLISSTNSTILNNNSKTPDYLTESTHKTVINVHNHSKSSSPIKDDKSIGTNHKFGQLSSYLDESFFKDTTTSSIKQMKSNGIMFTDLDEPFEATFDQLHTNNITKINIDDQLNNRNNSLNNSSMNSLSNSLTSNDTSIKEITNHKTTKMMNKLNLINNDYLVNELNNKMNLNNTDQLTNNNNIMNKKLNDKDIFDPFNSDWVSTLAKDDLNRNTNPFLQNMNTTVNTYKTFELKM